ncbi:hypothetical protein KP509_24G064800 [Ceratopteris richardii]|uniref:Dirigent protein n=1 Tax=Ceratopteris richardii TaxID=49495 RepID=A0A8T2RVJ6_CERRI|nr:hypothetical protein KP509_24G064800 [Ceratopteris richardii]
MAMLGIAVENPCVCVCVCVSTLSCARTQRPSFAIISRMALFKLLVAVMVVAWSVGAEARGSSCSDTKHLSFYLQQEIGLNELIMVPAARPPVNGTATGFGMQMVYEFIMTQTEDPDSAVMGYVRGTALAVNNTAAATVFVVNNVVHMDFNGVQGTLSQQGEGVFTDSSWEFSIVGGTGAFRMARGYM